MELILDPDFLDDLRFWAETDAKVAVRVLKLIEEIRRDPFHGTGKPEPLKHLGSGSLVAARHTSRSPRLLSERRTRELGAVPVHY